MSGSITIKDNATVTGTSSNDGAGIGSGYEGEMSGSITIGGTAKVFAAATSETISGAGIGSGSLASMSGSITIDDTADVTATAVGELEGGAGIGSGHLATMSGVISISNKATVNASSKGGKKSGDAIGAGAGGSTKEGTIQYFEPELEPTEPEPTQPEPAVISPIVLYRVLDENGLSVSCVSRQKDGVLTITAQRDEASLIIMRAELKLLSDRGVKTIVFITDGAASALPVSDLLTLGKSGDSLCLTHKGAEVTLTLGGETLTDVLKPWSPEQQ